MNKKLSFLILMLIFFQHNSIFSQGYRGKRFSISYQPGYSMVTPSYDFKSIIMHQKVNVGFAIAKHWSVNLIGAYTNSREMQNSNFQTLQVKDITGGVSINYFKKNLQSFAPIGRFVGLSIEVGSQNLVRNGFILVNIPPTPKPMDYYDTQKRGSLVLISAIFGKNFLIKEHIIFGYGVQFGYCTGGGPYYRHLIKPQFNFGIIL